MCGNKHTYQKLTIKAVNSISKTQEGGTATYLPKGVDAEVKSIKMRYGHNVTSISGNDMLVHKVLWVLMHIGYWYTGPSIWGIADQ